MARSGLSSKLNVDGSTGIRTPVSKSSFTRRSSSTTVNSAVIEIDHGWDRIVSGTKALSGKAVAAGIMNETYDRPESSKFPRPLQVAKVGFWQEYGTKFYGGKHFMGNSFDQNVDDYVRIGKQAYKDWQIRAVRLPEILSIIGAKMKSDIMNQISEEDLIDSGKMIESVEFQLTTGFKEGRVV